MDIYPCISSPKWSWWPPNFFYFWQGWFLIWLWQKFKIKSWVVEDFARCPKEPINIVMCSWNVILIFAQYKLITLLVFLAVIKDYGDTLKGFWWKWVLKKAIGQPNESRNTKKSQIFLHARHRVTNTKLGLHPLNTISITTIYDSGGLTFEPKLSLTCLQSVGGQKLCEQSH